MNEPKQKTAHQITGQQLYEMKWFCSSVVGVRVDFYRTQDHINKFNDRLERLEKTCALIEKFLNEKIEPMPSGVFE